MLLNLIFLLFQHEHAASEVWEPANRGSCWLWNWHFLTPYIIANGLIFSAYFAIPIQFFLIARKRIGKWMTPEIVVFGLFILLCGVGHLNNVLLIWLQFYPFAIAWDLMTGIVSIGAAVMVARHIKVLAALPDRGEVQALGGEIDKALEGNSLTNEARFLLEKSREFITRVESLAIPD